MASGSKNKENMAKKAVFCYNKKMAFLNPSSVAVIGASAQEGKVGHDILKNLLTQGYAGEVFPVNPKGGEILGKKAYPSVKDVPSVPDLAVIVIPAVAVPGALRECGEKGVKNVVIISAGFGEVHTDEGKKLEEELIAIAKEFSIQLIGPNCLGVIRPSLKMNASFAKDLPPAGNIALISQSGATVVALVDAAPGHGLGFSAVLSIGNKAVLDESDYVEVCGADDETKVIGLYLESIKDGKRFLEIASKVAQTKPIVLLKAGVSQMGTKAASSHTGALAGNDKAVDALCSEAGIHRAHTTEELFDLLSVLSQEPPLPSPNIAIVTNAGGPGILATDAAEAAGLHLPQLTEKNAAELKPKLPAAASIANPIDVIGDAGADRYEAALTACRDDKNIDGVVVLLTPQVMTPCEEVAETIVRIMKSAPLMPVTTAFVGGEGVAKAREILRKNGIPTFETPERAVKAMAALTGHESLVIGQESRSRRPVTNDQRRDNASSLLEGKSGLLDEDTTRSLFALYDLPMPKQDVAKTADEAASIAETIGYPVILKISSPEILHKTDVGGVRANLKTSAEVKAAFDEILKNVGQNLPNLKSPISNILVQQFLPVGNEFIVGSIRDASFGPLIMVGLGGIYTELFKDTAFRIAPVSSDEAYEMLQELKSWKLLLGMRGAAQSDIDSLANLVASVAQMVIDCPCITELDLNPVLVSNSGVIVADAKVVL